jgi:glycerol-1-phosphatase
MLKACSVALWENYDIAMLDLDGVVYVGADAVPGAPDHLAEASAAGMHLAYVTNNASRPTSTVAEHLRELGVDAADTDVVNSAQAAARLLADRLPEGSPVFVIGGIGLFEALAERGLRGVQTMDDEPVAVVSGYHPDVLWRTVMAGAILVQRGLLWVASNTDMTVPTADGNAPGNGVLVDTVARFAERQPLVAGKPEPPLFEETLRRVGGERPLVVGDRLDTDIEGAVNCGYDSLLVMTGVTGLDALVAAEPNHRPSYISSDLGGLGRPHPIPVEEAGGCTLNGWHSTAEAGALRVTGDGNVDDWWRVVAATAWRHLDSVGQPVAVGSVRPPSSVGDLPSAEVATGPASTESRSDR